MNAIVKAHLEGKEAFDKQFGHYKPPIDDPYKPGVWSGGDYEQFKSFLTTYGTNLLKAALEAGPGEKDHVREGRNTVHANDEYWGCCECYEDKHFNSCRTSFISAIDDGIKEISK